MKVLNVCSGALGSFFLGNLAKTGAEVSVTVRAAFEKIRDEGILIHAAAGDFRFKPAGVYRTAEEYPEIADYVVLTAKALPGADPVKLLQGAIRSKETVIVLIQNGIGIEENVAKAFPENELISTVAYVGATRTAPGEVTQKGASRLIMGRFGGGDSAKGRAFAAQFAGTPVQAEFVENVQYHRWKKLFWNIPFNVGAVLMGGLNTREMCDRGEVENLCRTMMKETAQAAAAEGFVFTDDDFSETMEFTRNFPPYKSSMLVDYENGRPMEIEAILGNVCKSAKAHGVAVPHLDTCLTLIRSVAAQAAKK